MSSGAVKARIVAELSRAGLAVSSCAELGVTLDTHTIGQLRGAVSADIFDPDASANADSLENMKHMIIARGAETLRLGSELLGPLMNLLLPMGSMGTGSWSLYGVNRYDEIGASFEPHMDPPVGTVIVVSLAGERNLGVYEREPGQSYDKPETFRTIERRLLLVPESVLLIDGKSGPPHEVHCTVAPSLSIVVDMADSML